jgi:phage FluMu gp28-like protein
VKSRRIGGSYAAAIDAANMAAGMMWDAKRGSAVIDSPCDVHVVSATFEQAKNLVAEVGRFCDAAGQFDSRFKANVLAESVTLANGCAIYALPCRAQSLRGYTGAVVLDEVTFYQNLEEVWGAAKIVAGQNLRNPRGYSVSLITTPWADGSLAHRLMTSPDLPFQRLAVDIYQAKKAGFPIDLEATRQEVAIEEIWLVEYCCQWLKGGSSFFSPELLARACCEELPPEVAKLPSYYGIDIGRTHDLTAIVETKRLGDQVWIVSLEALRNMPIPEQIARLSRVMRGHDFVSSFVDRGLMGVAVLDGLQAEFQSKVEGSTLDNSEQEFMAVELRAKLENDKLRIYKGKQPDEMRQLCAELASIRATPTSGHKTKFDTPRDQAGHGDRAWAAMLSTHAALHRQPTRPRKDGVFTSDFETSGIY